MRSNQSSVDPAKFDIMSPQPLLPSQQVSPAAVPAGAATATAEIETPHHATTTNSALLRREQEEDDNTSSCKSRSSPIQHIDAKKKMNQNAATTTTTTTMTSRTSSSAADATSYTTATVLLASSHNGFAAATTTGWDDTWDDHDAYPGAIRVNGNHHDNDGTTTAGTFLYDVDAETAASSPRAQQQHQHTILEAHRVDEEDVEREVQRRLELAERSNSNGEDDGGNKDNNQDVVVVATNATR